MITINNTIYYTYPILGFLKQQFKDEQGLVRLTVKSKVRLRPLFYFYKGTELIYIAIIKKSKNLIRFQLEISNPDGTHIATISEKPLLSKKTLFKEYSIDIGNEVYNVQYRIANRSFTIGNLSNTIVAQGTAVTPFFRNIFNLKKYKVNFHENRFPEELWMAIVYGVFLLD